MITCLGSVLAFKFFSSHPGQNSRPRNNPPYLFPGAKGWTPRSSTKRAQFVRIFFPQLASNHQQPDTLNANKKILKMKISGIHWLGVTHPNIFNIQNKDNLLTAGVAAGKALKRGGAPRSSTTAQRHSCTPSPTPRGVSLEHNWEVTTILKTKYHKNDFCTGKSLKNS